MKVSKNRWKGSEITDLNELVVLAECKESVVLKLGGYHIVRPAAFILNWPIAMVLRHKIFHSLDYEPKSITN